MANGRGEVWVFAEADGGRLAGATTELLGKGRELADKLGVRLGAVLLGSGVRPLADELFACGSDVVYIADHEALSPYRTLPYARIVGALASERRPEVVLYGATPVGRDLAPRIASALRTGLTADCTDLQIGDYDTGGATYREKLLQIRPAFGGNILATIVTPHRTPQMATVREGVMRAPERRAGRCGEICEIPYGPTDADLAVRVLERRIEEKRVDLKAAPIIVAGGYGMGSREGFRLVEELARVLGGVVGASRAAVDAGFIHRDHQVGQTGTTVRPKLYVACAISGSIQHRAGMAESAKIVAINRDPCAPIFEIAHYGIVGDVHEAIPRMIEAFKKAR